MAKTFTPQDIHAVMNALVKQATGQQSITVVDSSTFVSAGELVMGTGSENVLNSLSIVLGRTFMAVRPYEAKLRIINALNSGIYTNRVRKISFYAKDAQASGDYNTQLFTNLKNGYTNGQNTQANPNSTKSMWEQNQAVPLEMNFAGSDVWQDSITVYEDQLAVAFRSESEFGEFLAGIMTEKGNDIESQKEAFNRLAVVNKIASVYDMRSVMPGSVVNLTSDFNTKNGTNYTSAQLRTTYLKEFLAFFVAKFKITSDYMTNRSSNYHWSPTKTVDGVAHTLLRHTPKEKQRLLLFSPLFTEAEANVLPEIFHDNYLKMENYEGVTYWQSINSPEAINITPAVNDTETGLQKAGNNVILPYVVGMLYDVDGLMTDYQFESSNTTPLEARKRFRNIWWTFRKNIISDNTENSVIFIMDDTDVKK